MKKCNHDWIGTLIPDVELCKKCGKKRDKKGNKWVIRKQDISKHSDNNDKYSANDVDVIYLLGVFNVAGLKGLRKELKRLKKLNKAPHQMLDSLKH